MHFGKKTIVIVSILGVLILIVVVYPFIINASSSLKENNVIKHKGKVFSNSLLINKQLDIEKFESTKLDEDAVASVDQVTEDTEEIEIESSEENITSYEPITNSSVRSNPQPSNRPPKVQVNLGGGDNNTGKEDKGEVPKLPSKESDNSKKPSKPSNPPAKGEETEQPPNTDITDQPQKPTEPENSGQQERPNEDQENNEKNIGWPNKPNEPDDVNEHSILNPTNNEDMEEEKNNL